MTKMNVFITIDAEHSIGGAFENKNLNPVGNEKRIFGELNGNYYGIPLMMDIADQFNIVLNFFVEVFNKYYFGEQESRKVCEYILRRQHDVHLHLHPNWLNFTETSPEKMRYKDNMSSYSMHEQADMLSEGKKTLSSYTGKKTVAFRAGNFAADLNTLQALDINNFAYDSSFNPALMKNDDFILRIEEYIASQRSNVLELPVTSFQQKILFRKKSMKYLDINGLSSSEILYVLKKARSLGISCVVLVMHSFSFLKAYDIQYEKCKVRKNKINCFRKICRFLSEHNSDFEVRSFHGMNDVSCSVNMKNLSIPGHYALFRVAEVI